ncbi:hypothetical protein [Carboxylicivirga sp. N1Y90]|uniref:hypothetical protein n=1 Tax=Carboxylicivirga fragile TaxID=3417571 RepID=UPI003D3248EA|nr:hypothetical protein [Marinilabiliaceae bacterium N1Y90]
MKLSFTLKSLGKKRAYINKVGLEIDISSKTCIRELLQQVVSQQVNTFNMRKEERNLLVYLNEDTVNHQAETGQIKFDERYNSTMADEEKAKTTVLMAFEDGLIALFINEKQFEDVNQAITLKENDSITFIRLTFLAGSIW